MMKRTIGITIAALTILSSSAVRGADSTTVILRPIVGASFGTVQIGANPNVARISYWGGVYVKQVTPQITSWVCYQQTKLEDLNLTGKGGKVIFVARHDEYEEWRLLFGGGFLSDYALEGDGQSRTSAFTLDLGVLYQWIARQLYVGALGSAVDYGPKFDYSADIGLVMMF